eukprot:TRINITY_DN3265_c1_g1_i1.p4 TRINITY_DN3265_c1_g1~~TRINITY_DN3265_c1_g1_i1.p4  ORF type:complete len:240 (-),score=-15.32 TRINITY_DN3265_c1_g1_i1:189-908(-)
MISYLYINIIQEFNIYILITIQYIYTHKKFFQLLLFIYNILSIFAYNQNLFCKQYFFTYFIFILCIFILKYILKIYIFYQYQKRQDLKGMKSFLQNIYMPLVNQLKYIILKFHINILSKIIFSNFRLQLSFYIDINLQKFIRFLDRSKYIFKFLEYRRNLQNFIIQYQFINVLILINILNQIFLLSKKNIKNTYYFRNVFVQQFGAPDLNRKQVVLMQIFMSILFIVLRQFQLTLSRQV